MTDTVDIEELKKRLDGCIEAASWEGTRDDETLRKARGVLDRLQQENEQLKERCAEAYQLAGVVGAPLRFLDALGDAANGEIGKRFDGELLPVGPEECSEIAERDKRIAELQRELDEARKFKLEDDARVEFEALYPWADLNKNADGAYDDYAINYQWLGFKAARQQQRELDDARKDAETALRDKFAIATIGAVMSIPDSEWPWDFSGNLKDELGNDDMGYSDHVAFGAYSIADSMIRARQQQR